DNTENPEAPPPVRSIRITFTHDGKYVAATTFPPKAEKRGKTGLLMVDIATMKETRVADVASMQVPENGGDWIAYLKGPKTPPAAENGQRTATPGDEEDQRGAGRGAGAAAGGARNQYGSDLVVRALDSGNERMFEDVSEYTFAKDGRSLVYAVASRKEE